MADVTQILNAIDAGDPHAPQALLPLVYDELRKLAAGHLANESPANTLDATALVHEAYVRIVGPTGNRAFASRAQFFAAAAEAMRRILVDAARRRLALKRGGAAERLDLNPNDLPAAVADADQWLDLDAALTEFEALDPDAAALAKLRVFAGLSVEEVGETLGLPRATAFRTWTYARAWLTAALRDHSKNT